MVMVSNSDRPHSTAAARPSAVQTTAVLTTAVLTSTVRTSAAHSGGPDLSALLRSTAAGDRHGFTLLYAQLSGRVLLTARAIVRDPALAEDVTQEVFVEIWSRAAKFDPSRSSVTGWVLMMTRARAIDRVRAREAMHRQDHHFALRQRSRDTDTVSEQILTRDDHREVRAVLGSLTDLQREAIALSFYAGHSNIQASTLLGIPVATFKTRIRDALLKLREGIAASA